MLPNRLRTTLRYLWSRKFFSGINLLSLVIGLCVCFLAGLYVQFELSYDTYHEHADRIYRLVTDVETATGVNHESTSAPMAPALQSAFAEVESATRVLLDYLIVQPEDRSFFGEETVAYADPSLFSVFTFPLVSGNAATALEAPLTVVLTENGGAALLRHHRLPRRNASTRQFFGNRHRSDARCAAERSLSSRYTGVDGHPAEDLEPCDERAVVSLRFLYLLSFARAYGCSPT